MIFFIPEFLDCPICSSRMEKTNPEADPATVDFNCPSCRLDICQNGRGDEAFEEWFSNKIFNAQTFSDINDLIRRVKLRSFE